MKKRNYLSSNIRMWKLQLPKSDDENPSLIQRLGNILIYIIRFCLYTYYVMMLLNIYHYTDNIFVWSDSAAVIVGCSSVMFVDRSMTRNKGLINKLVEEMNTEMADDEDEFDIPSNLSIKEIERRNTVICRFLVAGAAIFSLLLPAIPLTEYYFGGSNRTIDVHKPAGSVRGRFWVPFDVTSFPMMITLYFYEAIILVYYAPYFYNSCGFVYSLSNHMNGRFKILQYSLRNIRKQVTIQMENNFAEPKKIQEDDKITNIFHLQTDIYDAMFQQLVKCIKYHQRLLGYCARVYIVVSPISLSVVLLTILDLCLAVFQASMAPVTDAGFIGFFIATFVVFSGMVMIGWSCSELTKQSIAVAYAAYDTDWYDAPEIYKKALLRIMTRANKGVILSAGGISEVDMRTSVQVTRAAYSFFTIMRKIK